MQRTHRQAMGVDPWVDLLFEVEGTPCDLFLYFFGSRRFVLMHTIFIGAIFVSQLILIKKY